MKLAAKNKTKKCVPCEDMKGKPMGAAAAKKMMGQVPGWKLEVGAKKITHTWLFADFKKSIKFVNAVAKIAEHHGHHPDVFIWYNKVRLDLWTHAIGGLSQNDFIIAEHVNKISS